MKVNYKPDIVGRPVDGQEYIRSANSKKLEKAN